MGAGPEGAEEIARHLHDLVEVDVVRGVRVAQADLGEPDRVGLAEQVRAVVVDLDDLDRERVEGAPPEADRLPTRGARRGVERHVHGAPTVERQLHVRDETVALAQERLDEVDVVGRDRSVEVDPDALPARVAEGLRPPRGAGIAVERGGGPVLGPVGDGVPVRGRNDALDTDVGGGGQRGRLLAREHVEPRVARVGRERLVLRACSFGEADVLLHGRPAARA